MFTSKPFATISYNSVDFLKNNLDTFIKSGVIDFYAFIKHKKEADEKKAHIHLFIVPSTRTNTNSLLSQFDELDPSCELPLRCMPAVSSKFGDWYMYCLHDKNYLASKGQAREFFYAKEDFTVSNEEYFDDCIHRIDKSKWVRNDAVSYAAENDIPFYDLVKNGQIPVQLINQYRYMYDLLRSNASIRNGRETHTPCMPTSSPFLVNPETGEIGSAAKLDPFENSFYEQSSFSG